MGFTDGSFSTFSPKAQVFARGFAEYAELGMPAKLRDCQNAGADAIRELGEQLSVPYISKLTKNLEALGVVEKVRVGRGFVVHPGPKWQDFIDFLPTSSFGLSLEVTLPDEDVIERSGMIDYLTGHDGVRISNSRPLPKAGYRVLIERFKEGKLDMVFVKSDSKVFVSDRLTNTRRIDEYPTSHDRL